tara:strand:+ start:5917 stop:7071 length:1155 start_codon:yes stop_codon:yes gene_type:complete
LKNRWLIYGLSSQLIYTVFRQILVLPLLALVDLNLFTSVSIFLLSADIIINVAGASQADSYIRQTRGKRNELKILKQAYQRALLLMIPILFGTFFIASNLISFLAISLYCLSYSHTLFSQKIALNDGKLYAIAPDFLIKSLALLIIYYYLKTAETLDYDESIIFFVLALCQIFSMFINSKLWNPGLPIFLDIPLKRSISSLLDKDSLFVPYAMMASLMRGEPLIIGFYFNQRPDVYIYFAFIALSSYLPTLLANGSSMNYIAQTSKTDIEKILKYIIFFSLVASLIAGWFFAYEISELIYPKNPIEGGFILALTIFFVIMTNIMKPKIALDGHLKTLVITFMLSLSILLYFLTFTEITFEIAFFIGASLRILCTLFSVKRGKHV